MILSLTKLNLLLLGFSERKIGPIDQQSYCVRIGAMES